MSTLDAVREAVSDGCTCDSCNQKRVALSEVDRLQSELSVLKAGVDAQVWFHLKMENHRITTELSALKQSLKDARPAIEAGANALDMSPSNDKDSWLLKLEQIKQLRGLLSLK